MLSQLFANPLMLAGAAAIAAPIALFLFNRFRFQTIEWAAQLFLQRAFQQQKRRLQFENLLLLLVRCAILIALSLGMARCRVVGEVAVDEGDAARNVLLVIDTSYSTSYQVGTTEDATVLAAARRTAKDVITALKDGDRVNVVAFDESVRVLYESAPRVMSPDAKNKLLSDLEEAPEMQASERGTDLAELLRALPRVLQTFDQGPDGMPPAEGAKPKAKKVLFLSDLQRKGFLDAKGQPLDAGVARVGEELKALAAELVLIDCGAPEPRNVTVTRIETRDPVVGRGLPCDVEVTIRNGSAVRMEDLSLEYYVNGERDQSVTIAVDPDQELTPEPRRFVFPEAGLQRIEVRVKSDGLQLDSRRQLVVDVRDEVRVLLVDGERKQDALSSETDFLRKALEVNAYGDGDGPGLIRADVIQETELVDRDLSAFDVIFLGNVVSFDERAITALEEYTRRGGVVVFGLGGLVNKDVYNQLLWREGMGLLPAKLLEIRGGTLEAASTDPQAPEWGLALQDVQGHALEAFSGDDMRDWLRGGSVFGYYGVELAKGKDAPWAPLTLVPRAAPTAAPGETPSVGDPLLVERPFGRGRSVAWLTTFDSHWSNLPVYDVFYVVFWQTLTLDLSQRTRPPVNLGIGAVYTRVLEATEYARQVEVASPDERIEGVPLTKLPGEDGYRLTYPLAADREGLQASGIYTLTRKGVAQGEDPAPDYFAVRVDPKEGDLAKFSAEELGNALKAEVSLRRPELAREAVQADAGGAGSKEYWRWFIATALALMVFESILAAYFGRRRK